MLLPLWQNENSHSPSHTEFISHFYIKLLFYCNPASASHQEICFKRTLCRSVRGPGVFKRMCTQYAHILRSCSLDNWLASSSSTVYKFEEWVESERKLEQVSELFDARMWCCSHTPWRVLQQSGGLRTLSTRGLTNLKSISDFVTTVNNDGNIGGDQNCIYFTKVKLKETAAAVTTEMYG